MAIKGYDAIDTGHNHVVTLNITVLIMEGDDE